MIVQSGITFAMMYDGVHFPLFMTVTPSPSSAQHYESLSNALACPVAVLWMICGVSVDLCWWYVKHIVCEQCLYCMVNSGM